MKKLNLKNISLTLLVLFFTVACNMRDVMRTESTQQVKDRLKRIIRDVSLLDNGKKRIKKQYNFHQTAQYYNCLRSVILEQYKNESIAVSDINDTIINNIISKISDTEIKKILSIVYDNRNSSSKNKNNKNTLSYSDISSSLKSLIADIIKKACIRSNKECNIEATTFAARQTGDYLTHVYLKDVDALNFEVNNDDIFHSINIIKDSKNITEFVREYIAKMSKKNHSDKVFAGTENDGYWNEVKNAIKSNLEKNFVNKSRLLTIAQNTRYAAYSIARNENSVKQLQQDLKDFNFVYGLLGDKNNNVKKTILLALNKDNVNVFLNLIRNFDNNIRTLVYINPDDLKFDDMIKLASIQKIHKNVKITIDKSYDLYYCKKASHLLPYFVSNKLGYLSNKEFRLDDFNINTNKMQPCFGLDLSLWDKFVYFVGSSFLALGFCLYPLFKYRLKEIKSSKYRYKSRMKQNGSILTDQDVVMSIITSIGLSISIYLLAFAINYYRGKTLIKKIHDLVNKQTKLI